MISGRSDEQASSSNEDVASSSYTALRLKHASPEHLRLTTRRCFIGPIPEGWLKSHRKSWYNRYLARSDYSSRTATFSARPGISHERSITGLDGPPASERFTRSFPQPDDIDDTDGATSEDGETHNSKDNVDGSKAIAEYESSGDSEIDEGMNELEAQATAADNGTDKHEVTPFKDEGPQKKPKRRSTMSDRLKPRGSKDKASSSSFVTAPVKPRRSLKSKLSPLKSAKSPPNSFVTAAETPDERRDPPQSDLNDAQSSPHATGEPIDSRTTSGSDTQSRPNGVEGATQNVNIDSSTNLLSPPQKDMTYKDASQPPQATSHGIVTFNIDDNVTRKAHKPNAESTQAGRRKSCRRIRQGSTHPGEIVKMEKMLVRVDFTVQELPLDYNENDSLKTESRVVEKWREFVVVCRESMNQDADFSIQMYKTRVIPSKEDEHVKKKSTYEIPLTRKTTRVNLYSSLDKTLVIWLPSKMGTKTYILRTHSVAGAVEWYTFIRHSLGSPRTKSLQVSVPDLSVTLQLENPFGDLQASMTAAQAEASIEARDSKTTEAEKAVASSIIQRCLEMLENNPEWSNVLQTWMSKEKMGLAWKRYDRLEWVHGSNEERMYGTLGMEKTHELELRPKDHYPTSVSHKLETMNEPAPVEGFLIRLTSQKGHVRSMGKMYFKRLYFTVHNQFLCYSRPAKAMPPPPPKLALVENSKVPSANEIVDSTPLIYAVNPYPTTDDQIEWLRQGTPASKERHNGDAYREAERKVNSLLQAEGYINLSHVVRVQNARRGNSPADAHVDQGPDVDFHEEVEDSRTDDGKTSQFDDKRTFELVMKNKLVIRLQAYDEVTKNEWMSRLRKLVTYWKLRLRSDLDTLKAIRRSNLELLEIDEESEAFLGQFGSKWEVTRSIASPKLFNMCGISCCRAITMSGTLYRKPKMHSTFQRCGVILCHGQLLVFHGTLRKMSGKEVPHIQHERQAAIELKNCYIYSGLVTEGDLLYHNQTFDSNHPGHHALPRVYLEDGWTSTDEDMMTCFVIWQPRNKSLFKASAEEDSGRMRQKLRYVSRLGVPGRSIVFKARSRTERDHWVMSIGMEIDRVQGTEDVRIVNKQA